MACIKLITYARAARAIAPAHRTQQTDACVRFHACSKWGLKTEAETVRPSSPRQPQALENINDMAERTTIQGTAVSRVMSAEIAGKRDTYKPCADAEALHDT